MDQKKWMISGLFYVIENRKRVNMDLITGRYYIKVSTISTEQVLPFGLKTEDCAKRAIPGLRKQKRMKYATFTVFQATKEGKLK